MKKLFLIIVSSILAIGAFTQTAESAKKASTAGTMNSSVDMINAIDIFDINQAFFSGASFDLFDTDDMQMAWAMPINETMTIGIVGNYKIDSGTDSVTVKGSQPIGNASAGGITPVDSLFEESVSTDDSAFNVNAVFMWTNIAFSYNIQRNGSSVNTDQSATLFTETNPVMDFSDKTNNANWIHELGFAYDMVDFMKVYVPVKVSINGSGQSNSTWKDASTAVTEETITETIAGKYINVDLSPEFIFPVSYGPVNEWSAGLGFNMDVYNPGDAISSTTTREGASLLPADISKTETNKVYEERVHLGTTISAGATMEWAKEKMTFIVEPSAMLTYDRHQGGTAISTTNATTVDGQTTKTESKVYEPTIDTFTPFLNTNVGMEITPNDWFALRMGFAYNMEWVNTFTSVYDPALDKELKSSSSTFESTFEPAIGMGFVIAEDFELDFDIDFINSYQFLEFGAFNITATYKF